MKFHVQAREDKLPVVTDVEELTFEQEKPQEETDGPENSPKEAASKHWEAQEAGLEAQLNRERMLNRIE
jgi:hypothetical protein